MSIENDTFCPLPWLHLGTHPHGGVTPCCISDMTAGKNRARNYGGERDEFFNLNDHDINTHMNSDYFKEIRTKLIKEIEIDDLEIIDNSHKHIGHKSYSPEKFHLHLKIKSLYLNSISRVNAQKIIMKILEEDLKNRIHALEISIEQ